MTAKAKGGGRGRVDARFLAEAVSRERGRCEENDDTAFGRYDEHHLSYAIARALEKSRDAWVVVEGTDGDKYETGERCDVYAHVAGEELWVEVKRAWRGVGDGWVGKPREQLKTWLRDLQKLSRFPRSARRAFVMLEFAQQECHDDAPPTWVAACGASIAARIRRGKDYLDLLPAQKIKPAIATALMEAVLRALSSDVYASRQEQGTATLPDGTKPWYRVFAAIF